jgi:DnaJ-class molecular chaperone
MGLEKRPDGKVEKIRTLCPKCDGKGTVNNMRCATCQGSGQVKQQ